MCTQVTVVVDNVKTSLTDADAFEEVANALAKVDGFPLAVMLPALDDGLSPDAAAAAGKAADDAIIAGKSPAFPLVRPFSLADVSSLLDSFDRWDTLPPCNQSRRLSESVDLVLYLSRNISGDDSKTLSVRATVDAFLQNVTDRPWRCGPAPPPSSPTAHPAHSCESARVAGPASTRSTYWGAT